MIPSNNPSNDSSLESTSFCMSAICNKRFNLQSVASIGVSGNGMLGTTKQEKKSGPLQKYICTWINLLKGLDSSWELFDAVSKLVSWSDFLVWFQGWAHRYSLGWSLFLKET